MRARLAVALGLSLLLAACSGEVTSTGTTRPVNDGARPAAASDPKARSDAGAKGSAAKPAARGKSAAPPDTGASPFNNMPLTLTLSARCAEPGDVIEAKAVTLPGSKLAFAAYYMSNNDFVPDMQYVPGQANVTGTYTWRLALRPTTPMGDARVSVVSSKAKRGAAVTEAFTVSRSC